LKVRFTIEQLEALKSQNKIRGYTEYPKKGESAKKPTQNKRGGKIKGWIDLNLKVWAEINGFELKKETRFHPERKWRFDWALFKEGDLKIGVEYNGIMSQKSRHTTITGYSGDLEKINAAQAMGIIVLQYSPLTHKNLLTDLTKLI
jgi:hypothetical protein